MSLTLYYHPLSSFCWKVLIALYENDVAFTPKLVNLGDAEERAALLKLWPVGKFPVLRDEQSRRTIPESSIIIEYLDQHHPGATRFIPEDPDRALQTRLRDRFLDLYVHLPTQTIVFDRLRPAEARNAVAVAEARSRLRSSYAMLEAELPPQGWATGDRFTLADCAALPALFYADKVEPLGADLPTMTAYLDRLKARPCVARVLAEAEPYFKMFPQEPG
ncbi:glutathione S-transferase family protein [Bradyrhizobium sp. HKCCYLS2038]|uniref:glutathione S-transferase family protein n=1 Tax=unclassified Bradyrhizobium TaxID=2631580 RepID=UPI003EBC6DDA